MKKKNLSEPLKQLAVGISFSASTEKAHILIKQIENENLGHSHWLLMALKSLLFERPDLTVKELVKEIEIICPDTEKSVNERMKNY
jgi:hypothetical protein